VSTTVTTLNLSAADRLRFTPDGHADPAQLLDCLVDADTRSQSTGLVYLAEHTRAADVAPARVESALPECHLCGNQAGPWVPDPSGDRWPSGAQKLVCAGGACRAADAGVEPRRWTFTDPDGERTTVTCMPGCAEDHTAERFAADICCYTSDGQAAMLPIDNGTVEDLRVLGVGIRCLPYDESMGARLPHAVVEVVEDHYIENLDPDALALLIATLQGRLDALRAAHTLLVSVRSEHLATTGISEAVAAGAYGPQDERCPVCEYWTCRCPVGQADGSEAGGR
jgi:hypothetical protein